MKLSLAERSSGPGDHNASRIADGQDAFRSTQQRATRLSIVPDLGCRGGSDLCQACCEICENGMWVEPKQGMFTRRDRFPNLAKL